MAKQTVYDWEKHRDHLLMEVERLTYQCDTAQKGVAGLAELQDRVDESTLSQSLAVANEGKSTTNMCSGMEGCWCDACDVSRLRYDVETLTKECDSLLHQRFGLEKAVSLFAEREAALQEQVAKLTAERDEAVAMRAEAEEGPCRWCDGEDHCKCEGCSARLPIVCAVTTEDPVYLCARCVAPMHEDENAGHLETIRTLREALDASDDIVRRYAPGCTVQIERNAMALNYDVKDGEG